MKGVTRLNIDGVAELPDSLAWYSSNRNVTANSEPVMVVGDLIISENIMDVFVNGSKNITVNGKAVVRAGDKTMASYTATGSGSVFFN